MTTETRIRIETILGVAWLIVLFVPLFTHLFAPAGSQLKHDIELFALGAISCSIIIMAMSLVQNSDEDEAIEDKGDSQ